MPVYEYRCEDCGEQFERRLPFSMADSAVPCTDCGEGHAKKILQTFAIGAQSPTHVQNTTTASSSGFT